MNKSTLGKSENEWMKEELIVLSTFASKESYHYLNGVRLEFQLQKANTRPWLPNCELIFFFFFFPTLHVHFFSSPKYVEFEWRRGVTTNPLSGPDRDTIEVACVLSSLCRIELFLFAILHYSMNCSFPDLTDGSS